MEEPNARKIIGRHQYAYLKSLKTPSLEEQKKLEDYEEDKLVFIKPSYGNFSISRNLDYKEEPKLELTSRNLSRDFHIYFELNQKKEFKPKGNSSEMLMTLIHYFIKDPEFYKSKCLSSLSVPSLNKGLLIIGDYGVCKTAMMKTFQCLFCQEIYETSLAFKAYNMNELINLYESDFDKYRFWNNIKGGRIYFDGVKTERIASYYGKLNLMERIFQDRYNSSTDFTFITCNYDLRHPGNLEKGLEEFKELYGSMVYDRLFEMFNILEFKGNSFRRTA